MKKAAVCCFLIIVMGGCNAAENRDEAGQEEVFFDLTGLVEKQIVLLNEQKPEVEKYLKLDGREETKLTREINWQDDLDFFLRSGISQPSIRGSYSLEKPSDLTEVYRLKEGETLPVRLLKVTYAENSRDVEEIYVESDVENRLFDTFKELKMTFTGTGGDSRLASYQIKGYQELKLGDKKDFEVRGLIKNN